MTPDPYDILALLLAAFAVYRTGLPRWRRKRDAGGQINVPIRKKR